MTLTIEDEELKKQLHQHAKICKECKMLVPCPVMNKMAMNIMNTHIDHDFHTAFCDHINDKGQKHNTHCFTHQVCFFDPEFDLQEKEADIIFAELTKESIGGEDSPYCSVCEKGKEPINLATLHLAEDILTCLRCDKDFCDKHMRVHDKSSDCTKTAIEEAEERINVKFNDKDDFEMKKFKTNLFFGEAPDIYYRPSDHKQSDGDPKD